MPHTPQPWKILDVVPDNKELAANLPNEYFDYIFVGGPYGEIARVSFPRTGEAAAKEQARANANLIVAAPALLMACQLLCALEDNEVDDADTRWKQVRNDMRTIIQKATSN